MFPDTFPAKKQGDDIVLCKAASLREKHSIPYLPLLIADMDFTTAKDMIRIIRPAIAAAF